MIRFSCLRAVARAQGCALALGRRRPLFGAGANVALAALHLAGLALVARLAHWPVWTAPLLLALFSLPQLLPARRGLGALAPLGLLYAVALLRLGWVYGLRRPVPEALSYSGVLAISAAWAALMALRAVGRLRLGWAGAAAGAAALLAWQLWRLAPAGVTGSDPFAYLQMALDLAGRGTARHAFPLAVLAANLGLPTLPAVHVGYVLPNAEGLAPTVWPPGFSALLAAAYRLGGEAAALTLNAWIGAAAVILTGGLGALLAPAPARWRGLPLAVGGLAACLVAASPEVFTRLAVPLADGAVLVFTTLAVGIVLVAGAGPARSLRDLAPARYALAGALAGFSLAIAFSLRYTQALAAPGLLLAAWWGLPRRGPRLPFAVAFAAAALLGALPDTVYRTGLYGAPWRFGTGELALFSAAALPEALVRLGSELLAPAEWGWLWPLALLGAAYAWRRSRRALAVLAAAYGPLLIFHLWYPFLRLRDLLSLYAPLAALTALGTAALLAAAWRWGRRHWPPRAALVAAALLLGAARLAPLLERQPGFYTFGYLLPEQRRAFEKLADLTERGAV
ncbi:MAG: hypothetical protein IT318_10580, partial [Anaerolineales bacterium]|nr:hypothetical protein [Anaerolineales bacterium]